jgi:hypothetical protein
VWFNGEFEKDGETWGVMREDEAKEAVDVDM